MFLYSGAFPARSADLCLPSQMASHDSDSEEEPATEPDEPPPPVHSNGFPVAKLAVPLSLSEDSEPEPDTDEDDGDESEPDALGKVFLGKERKERQDVIMAQRQKVKEEDDERLKREMNEERERKEVSRRLCCRLSIKN